MFVANKDQLGGRKENGNKMSKNLWIKVYLKIIQTQNF